MTGNHEYSMCKYCTTNLLENSHSGYPVGAYCTVEPMDHGCDATHYAGGCCMQRRSPRLGYQLAAAAAALTVGTRDAGVNGT